MSIFLQDSFIRAAEKSRRTGLKVCIEHPFALHNRLSHFTILNLVNAQMQNRGGMQLHHSTIERINGKLIEEVVCTKNDIFCWTVIIEYKENSEDGRDISSVRGSVSCEADESVYDEILRTALRSPVDHMQRIDAGWNLRGKFRT